MNNINISEINNNPMFRLSLGAKELFHSNFLAFLFEQSDLPNLQKLLLSKFDVDIDDVENYEIETLRERNNFDLIVWVKPKKWESEEEFLSNCHIIFIENKFKSVPTQKQLNDYDKKICNTIKNLKTYDEDEKYCNDEDTSQSPSKIIKRFARDNRYKGKDPYDAKNQIHKYLLGINKPAWLSESEQPHPECKDKYRNIDWEFVSYSDILGILEEANKTIEKTSFLSKMINFYYSFTDSILKEFENCFENYFDGNKVTQKFFYHDDKDKERLHSLRIKDLFEKYNISLLRNYLEVEIKDFAVDFEENFFRSTGLLSIWRKDQELENSEVTKMKCKGKKGIQIQGEYIKKFIQYEEKNNNNKENTEKYYKELWNEEPPEELKSYSKQFFYTEEKLDKKITYGEILEIIKELLK